MSWADAPATYLLPGSEVSAPEIDQAIADVQCRESVNLERVLFDAETGIQNELITESPFVQRFRDQIDAAVDRAKAYDPLS